MPPKIRPYIKRIMEISVYGRDGEYCSEYAKESLENYAWEDNKINKPSLKDFSRWCISVCKRGINVHNRKKPKSRIKSILPDIRSEIIKDIDPYFPDGIFKDSFIGSDVFDKIFKKYQPYNVTECVLASLVISERKRRRKTMRNEKVYFYIPDPSKNQIYIKIGKTNHNPIERMNDATKNTRTCRPLFIGWFYGNESKVKKHFKSFKVHGLGNNEIHYFDNINIVINYIKQNDGKIINTNIPNEQSNNNSEGSII